MNVGFRVVFAGQARAISADGRKIISVPEVIYNNVGLFSITEATKSINIFI